jgi:hypothetical protein
MRSLILVILASSLLAQPVWGWQRTACIDGSPCPSKSDGCCPPPPCEDQPVLPVSQCVLTTAPAIDYAPPAAQPEIHKPVFLNLEPPPSSVAIAPTVRPDRGEVVKLPHSLPKRVHAPRAPPRAA